MNITPINFRFFSSQNNVNYSNHCDSRSIKPNYKNSLDRDTVSFGAANFTTNLRDFYEKVLPRYKRIAKNYIIVTESIANKFTDDGVSFVKEMFEATAVKMPDSKLSKNLRSKSLEDRDAIRTTLFVKNPYDLSILFDKILPEYKAVGYNVAPIDIPVSDLMKRGYVPVDEELLIGKFFQIPHTKESHAKYFRELKNLGYNYNETKELLAEFVKSGERPTKVEFINLVKSLKKEMPDLDVRLSGKILAKNFDVSTLPEEYQYCIGKPQGSGYEDIQLRFIRDCDLKKEHPVYHELLIQFGPTYNKNAVDEHKYVYEATRKFKELQVDTSKAKLYSPAYWIDTYIEQIKGMFKNLVSIKLINNGKSADMLGNNSLEEVIRFSEDDITRHENNFILLNKYIDSHYDGEKKAAQLSKLASLQLNKSKRADKNIISEIKSMLDETISHFNYQEGLKDIGG